MTFDNVCSDMKRVIDHFGAKKAQFVGMSLGGFFAMEFYNRYPERVSSLVLCDTGEPADLSPEERAEFLRRRTQPLIDGKEPKDIAPSIAQSLVSPSAVESAYSKVRDGFSALRKNTFMRAIEMGMGVTKVNFAGVKAPSLVVLGEDDELPAHRALIGKIPGSDSAIIQKAGHICNVDQPEAFNQAVLPFLISNREN